MKPDIVIINCFDTYEHRVELLRKHFTAQGKTVRVLTSDWKHFHKTVRTDAPEGYELIHAQPYRKNLSVSRMASHYRFAQDAMARVEELAPRMIWALIPPNALAQAAVGYKKKHPDVKLVLDLIDMWPETMPISKFKTLPPFSWWRKLRDGYVGQADAVVTECRLYQTILKENCPPEKLHTLYLARPWAENTAKVDLPQDKVALCYLGSINNIIDIDCIGNIIRSVGGPVDLHIIGDGESREALISGAKEAGANVIFHGKVYDRAEKQAIMDRCHAGLNIMKKSVFVGLTMKSMDYFECGIPIVNNIQGDTWNFMEEFGIGVNIGEDGAVSAQELHKLQKRRGEVHPFGNAHFDVAVFNRNLDKIIENL